MTDDDERPPADRRRRAFLDTAARVSMAGGLAASYGTFAAMAGRFLYPAQGAALGWLFVTEVARLEVGASLTFRTPSGARAAIARRAGSGEVSDFIALSSTCPHLGCQVHWEGAEGRFFCPCHNGTFDPTGRATGGPPAEAGQSLLRYPLKVEGGLLFIQVALEELGQGEPEAEPAPAPRGPGHDPCLLARPRPRRA